MIDLTPSELDQLAAQARALGMSAQELASAVLERALGEIADGAVDLGARKRGRCDA